MRLLVVKLSSLGDILHALPAVDNLRRELEADVHWVTQPEYVDLVSRFEGVSRVVAFPRRGFARQAGRFIRELRAADYDLAVDFQGLIKSAVATRLARARRRIGPSFCREGTRLLYPEIAGRPDRRRHAVEQALDTVRYLGLPLRPPVFPIRFERIVPPGPRPRLAICPMSRWASKNWPADRFIEVAKRLHKELGASVHLVGGTGDAAVCEAMRLEIGAGAVNLAGKTSLPELAGLLASMDLLLSNDSGPIHVAAAVGTPVLAVFGPTDATRTGPYGERHRVLSGFCACRPCYRRVCVRHPSCMDTIAVDAVEAAAIEMLQQFS